MILITSIMTKFKKIPLIYMYYVNFPSGFFRCVFSDVHVERECEDVMNNMSLTWSLALPH